VKKQWVKGVGARKSLGWNPERLSALGEAWAGIGRGGQRPREEGN